MCPYKYNIDYCKSSALYLSYESLNVIFCDQPSLCCASLSHTKIQYTVNLFYRISFMYLCTCPINLYQNPQMSLVIVNLSSLAS